MSNTNLMGANVPEHETDCPFFSIIVPIYCGGRFVETLVSDVRSQGLSEKDYELIFVDDASTDDTAAVISEVLSRYPNMQQNLHIHEVNKKQGGARNTGIKNASGKYICFVDADDHILPNALSKLKSIIESEGDADLMMFNYQIKEGDRIEHVHRHLPDHPVDGKTYLSNYDIKYAPWQTVYHKSFLLKKDIWFAEYCTFEDADFILRCIFAAKKIIATPLEVIQYLVWEGQTCKIWNDSTKVEDMMHEGVRIRKIAEEETGLDSECGKVVMWHYLYRQKMLFLRYLWHLPYRKTTELLRKYPTYTPSGNWMLDFSAHHPILFAIMLQCMKPALHIARKIYLLKKGQGHS